jgi:hypothetical protein
MRPATVAMEALHSAGAGRIATWSSAPFSDGEGSCRLGRRNGVGCARFGAVLRAGERFSAVVDASNQYCTYRFPVWNAERAY